VHLFINNTVKLVLVLVLHFFDYDYEHRYAEHEHDNAILGVDKKYGARAHSDPCAET